ncbi:CHAT domain-containing protein [Sorangium sp. So ce1389]|uniref:CHAT domain-containing protein n=1 Tax=Sorangium sp. So ce1389 TaxID=3133336 RepID=UPI003F63464B
MSAGHPRAAMVWYDLGVPRPATILFLGANPSGTTRLALDREVREIGERLRGSHHRDAFQIQQEWAVRATDLQERLLRHRPAIVHFSGHGSSIGELILEDSAGNAKPVTTAALGSLFRILRRDVRCVLLNACFSEAQARAIAEHVDCVVGMTAAVDDDSAIAFAGAFYQALGYGESVQTAFDLGCGQIDLAGLANTDVPRLIEREGARALDTRFVEAPGVDRPL